MTCSADLLNFMHLFVKAMDRWIYAETVSSLSASNETRVNHSYRPAEGEKKCKIFTSENIEINNSVFAIAYDKR